MRVNNGAAGSLGAGGEAAGVGTKSPAVVERKLGQGLSSTESWSALTGRRGEALLFGVAGRGGFKNKREWAYRRPSSWARGINQVKQEKTRIRARALLVTTSVCDGRCVLHHYPTNLSSLSFWDASCHLTSPRCCCRYAPSHHQTRNRARQCA